MVSKKTSIVFYGLAGVALLLYIIFLIREQHSVGGWFGVLFFISLAIAFRSNKFLKGLSFTVIIFAAVVLAMYHPGYF